MTVIIPDVPPSESEMGCGEEEESDELYVLLETFAHQVNL